MAPVCLVQHWLLPGLTYVLWPDTEQCDAHAEPTGARDVECETQARLMQLVGLWVRLVKLCLRVCLCAPGSLQPGTLARAVVPAHTRIHTLTRHADQVCAAYHMEATMLSPKTCLCTAHTRSHASRACLRQHTHVQRTVLTGGAVHARQLEVLTQQCVC